MGELDAEYFSDWYADMGDVTEVDQVWTRLLRLPPHVLSTSLVPGVGLDELERLVGLGPDGVLLDLACGRAGYGLELAARADARLVGVDFAPAAIEQARANAVRLGQSERAEFRVADMAGTALDDASVDAVICIDALPFADDPEGPAAEMFRVLAPGRPVVLTGWEAIDPTDESLPERLRRVDLDGTLRAAGFVDVHSSERPEWAAIEYHLWEELVALPESDDAALRARQEEARDVLTHVGHTRRVLAHGRRP